MLVTTMTSARGTHRVGIAAFLYALLIVYGSLYPFSGWIAREAPFAFLDQRLFARVPLPDLLTNVLAYVPLGLMTCLALGGRRSGLAWVLSTTAVGFCLSFSMEVLQAYLPSRVSSLSDLVANTVGTLAGALTARFLSADSLSVAWLKSLRSTWFRGDRLTDLGLIAIGLWAASQLIPFVPSFDVGKLRQGLAPIAHLFAGTAAFNTPQFATYLLNFAGLALIAKTVTLGGRHALRLFLGFGAVVLALKVPIVMRQLTIESILGLGGGVTLAVLLGQLSMRAMAWASAALISAGFLVFELTSDPSGQLTPFNWIPFRGHMVNPLTGIAAILETIWPAAALAYLARLAATHRARHLAAWGGGLLLTAYSLTLELLQERVPGRLGDITTVLLMAAVWGVYWCVRLDSRPDQSSSREPGQIPGPALWKVLLSAASLLAIMAGLVTWTLAHQPVERPLNEAEKHKLPAAESLPPVSLPGFRVLHPRLPHPSVEEIAFLQQHNPAFLRFQMERAQGGRGDLEPSVLTEFVQPGTQDLRVLHEHLMNLKFSWRGHEQVKPIAVAYDWLYANWTPTQRGQLRAKLADGCQYVIARIRDERHSPYNVYLYNSPFQALVACAIALYRDDPRGDAVMAFTYDLWKHRMLPVWRQVMGKNGGWHEGGEYVGIGIGQAIYQVPEMWRYATGEDLFASESGIRGFLDFLIFRTRPDGTHFRWGDAGYFDRIVPDAAALALRYRHAAAYTLAGPRDPVPTSWPWGPLADSTLIDPDAITQLPLTRLFDGIGLIVARSDWSPDATYLSFKAGDNFWSHSHLDQGAFTIYKGGALAIDSGLYGPKYGADHYMNYAYQAIAHNVITVTDPDDRVPAPGKERPRPIANDGGQRRIGSGWGVEAAPLDREEWESKREIYHTGNIEKFFDADGLVVAVADITPAYTNRYSGGGTFSHRTRRVERLWRVFAYDRVDDVVIVYDDVSATRTSFQKRWLMHTIEAPKTSGDGFTVIVSPANHAGRGGGRLEGHVIFPEHPVINLIGGRGFEFFVDERNFDEAGQVWAAVRSRGLLGPEPGSWRIEISPDGEELDDQFLVVMLPSKIGEAPAHKIRALRSGDLIGCEIAGPARTSRWWFRPGQIGVTVEITDVTGTRSYPLAPTSPTASIPKITWSDTVKRWLRITP